ncbi:MAG TPA: YqzL family protein [Clostridiales bacterium]|nr:YqzL family protein [Clostridiales bacterium]
MLKEFVWNLFQKTGNVRSYVFYREIVERESALFEETKTRDEVAITGVHQ